MERNRVVEGIKEIGFPEMAQKLGIAESTLKRKTRTLDFTLGQIMALKHILNLSNKDLVEAFDLGEC